MKAILLIAGVGRRLGKPDQPKSLLQIAGRSLLSRHVRALEHAECSGLTVVVGYLQEQIREELRRIEPKMPVTVLENPDFREGSVVSLFTAREQLTSSEATIVMDGDVLYHHELLDRLYDSPLESAFLVDGRSEETGEEMMVAVRAHRALHIARRVGKGDEQGPWDMVGESVGFMKIGAKHAAVMRELLEAHVQAGHRNTEYEAVYEKALAQINVGVVDVLESPWTEIDFEEDVKKANEVVWPQIQAKYTDDL